MKHGISLLFALLTLAISPVAAGAAAPKPIYLSLGDSLAVGVQPGESGGRKKIANTGQGYPRRLAALLGGLRYVEYNGRPGVPIAVARICRLTWMCAALRPGRTSTRARRGIC